MAIRAVTFDVYSAMFDTVGGLTGALTAFFRGRGAGADAAAAARVWRRAQMDYLALANSLDRDPASNRAAIEASAQYTLRAFPPPVAGAELEALVAAWERLPPWPEAAEVLADVRGRPLTLGVLSNGDFGMLSALMQTFPAPFDRIISVEGGKFKPHPSVYRKALATLAEMGVRVEELLHVAGSASDAAGATAAGIRTIWINRAADAVLDPRFTPAHQSPDLRGVLPLL